MTLIALSLFYPSCTKPCFDPQNPDCEDYDPCFGLSGTSADFDMISCINCNYSDSLMRKADTIMGGLVYFEAQESLDTYTWKVGSDPRIFTEKRFRLRFSDFKGPINIQLVGTKRINPNCFPDDDGIDTVNKILYVTGGLPDSLIPITGVFEGYDESEPDSIYQIEHRISDITWSYGLDHFPKKCDRPENWLIGTVLGYTSFKISNRNGEYFPECGHPIGYGDLQADRKTLIIHYQVTENNRRIDKKFIGTKIK